MAGRGGSARAGAPDAVALARAGRCAEAVPLFEAGPETPERALFHSECLVRLRRYAEAAPLLEALVDRDPALAEAWLPLGMARFHLGDPEGAEAALLRAEPALAARPELRLYRGLAWLARGDAAGAAALLDGCRRAMPDHPPATRRGSRGFVPADPRAHDSLRRVLALAPESAWAMQAAEALRGSAEPGRRWWIRGTAGYEYDDNVVLRAGDVPLAREISSQRDTRAMWRLEAGSEWWRREAWSSGVWLDYSGTAHDDLSSLDVHLPGIGLWLDRRLDAATTPRLAYDFSWAFVDGDSFLQSHGVTASAFRSFGSLGVAQLFGRFYDYDYQVHDVDVPTDAASTSRPARRRSPSCAAPPASTRPLARSRRVRGRPSGFLHASRLDRLRTELCLGYTCYRYWADGEEQSYAAHEGRAGTRRSLPLGVEPRLDAAYAYRPYRHASSVPEPFSCS